MKLENRLPAEGINAALEHPLKEFAALVVTTLAVMVALIGVLAVGARWLAPRIPYSYEARLAAGLDLAGAPKSAAARAVQSELQALAGRLATRMALPEGMIVRVGYRDSGTVNAFASLGGQTVFFRGLIGKLESEDALAMVMAHELAHLKHRHPAAALGRGVAAGLVLSVVSVEFGRSAAGSLLGHAGMLTLLSFNRDQEREADEEALRVLAQEYGHVGGALDLFDVFTALPGGRSGAPVELFRTHPLTASRVANVRAWAARHGTALEGERRPLPPAVAAARAATQKPGE